MSDVPNTSVGTARIKNGMDKEEGKHGRENMERKVGKK